MIGCAGIRNSVTKNKIDDRYQAEIFEVIRPKALGLPLYLVKGLESGTIKEIHRDNLVLFHQANPSQDQVTIDKIATWDQMNNKKFETDDDEEYSVKKQLNNKIAIHYGDPTKLTADINIVINSKVNETDFLDKLKDARQNDQHTAIITINDIRYQSENIKIVLKCIRRDLSHKNWKKVLVVTNHHVTYNHLLEQMCTYFPKTVLQKDILFSDSDDTSCSSDSDDEFEFNQLNRVSDDNSIHSASSSDSDNDGDDQPHHRYNLRREARRPPNYMKDYVVHFLLPH